MTYRSIKNFDHLQTLKRITAKVSSIVKGKTQDDRRKLEGLRRKDESRTRFCF